MASPHPEDEDRASGAPTPDRQDQQAEQSASSMLSYLHGTLTVQPGQPLIFAVSERPDVMTALTAEQRARTYQIAQTLRAYRESSKSLLSSKYPDLRGIAPVHMRTACDCLAIVCDDGIIVRYDRHPGDDPKVRVVTGEQDMRSITAVAPRLSEGHVHCPADPASFQLSSGEPQLQLAKFTPASGEYVQFGSVPLTIIVVPWGELRRHAPTSDRPVPLVSLANECDLLIEGEVFKDTQSTELGTGQRFILRGHLNLPVGWERLEVYPPFDPAAWQPSVAPIWAELDLLAAVARHNLPGRQLQAVDPYSVARRQYMALFKEFEALLNGPEAPLQRFLKEHPELLSPTHTRVWPKLSLGARDTDFVFREPPNDYLLVEIEAPTRILFRKDGQPHQELNHAVDQTREWVRYIEDNLSTVQRELGLAGLSTSPRRLVVIGRSGSLTIDNRRMLATVQNQEPKLRIMTYDDLLATARATVENLLGPLWDTRGDVEVYYLPRR